MIKYKITNDKTLEFISTTCKALGNDTEIQIIENATRTTATIINNNFIFSFYFLLWLFILYWIVLHDYINENICVYFV